jgi:hypothetical protein
VAEKMRKKSYFLRTLLPIISVASILCFAIGCNSPAPALAPTPVPTTATALPTIENRQADLSDDVAATLNSLEKVNNYPLYTMHYSGAYIPKVSSGVRFEQLVRTRWLGLTTSPPAWACSLFMAAGKAGDGLYGRNFDWEYSPAVLLFTDPPGGYASVSMVDLAYLGFGGSKADKLTDLPLKERQTLLNAPFLPFDGMNEYGLTIGMAAVPETKMPYDPDKETISSLMIIREMLDHARNVDEAVVLLQSYNIDMGGGPPIHYLIADSAGRSALVEFDAGEMVIIATDKAWHLATNHLHNAADNTGQSGCWRYNKIYQRLADIGGQLATRDALDLLAEVSQDSTQWSVVYSMKTGEINVAMGREYTGVQTFHLRLVAR